MNVLKIDEEHIEELRAVLLQTQLLVDLTGATYVPDGAHNEDEQWNAALMSIEHELLDFVRAVTKPNDGGPLCFIAADHFEVLRTTWLRAELLAELTSSSRFIERRGASESWNAYLLHLAGGLKSFVETAEALAAQ